MKIKGGKHVAFEIMKEILQAEQRAEDILKQASVEKETMKAEAIEKSKNIIADAQKMAKQASEQKIAKAIAESQPKKDKILAEATKCCEEIKETATTRLEQAADAVIRKVVG